MPLLGVNGAAGDYVCLGCGNERTLPHARLGISDSDSSTFTTPPCPTCGAVETFTWHDWVYLSRGLGGRPTADPAHFGARQMVLVAQVAQAAGRTRRRHPNQRASYPEPPQPHAPDEVRAWVAAQRLP